jgi:hypothetical protein
MSDGNCSRVDVDWITALDPSDVNFKKLDDISLEKLATGSEPYFATLAINELRRRQNPAVAAIARALLQSGTTDKYLKASALGVIFDFDPSWAIEYMLVQVTNADAYLLNAIMNIAIRDSEYFKSGSGYRLTRFVVDRLKEFEHEKYPPAEVTDLFSSTFDTKDGP